MSSINRKIQRKTKVNQYPMIPVSFTKVLRPKSIKRKFTIEVSKYNRMFFNTSQEFIEAYELFYLDFIQFIDFTKLPNEGKKGLRVIDFLNDSVENNYQLCDYITNVDFTILKDHILFNQDNQEKDFTNTGEFYFDKYQINCSGSYMFFKDLLTQKKFVYYGD